ncbi:MAG: 3-hydroxybutyryl-CoA dehydrogenase [Pseudomonadota bacterium]
MTIDGQRVAAVGAGRMGRGIALAFAYGGYEIDLIDLKVRTAAEWARLCADAREEIASSLSMLAELGAIPQDAVSRLRDRIHLFPESESAERLAGADVIFEGVTETHATKKHAFERICLSARPDAILASTTSTILVTDLLPFVTHPERLLNAHWLNPAYVIPLVELSVHPGTTPETVGRLRSLLEDIGKVPVVCGPTPGYIVPRLQALIMNEAARMIEEGAATAEEIDKATRLGLGLRFAAMGVIEFIDYGGNDILYHASRYLSETISRERYTAPDIVQRLMHDGLIGLKSGQGFYDYRERDLKAYRKDVLARILGMLRHVGLQRPPR